MMSFRRGIAAVLNVLAAAWLALTACGALANSENGLGLSAQAYQELRAKGLDKYLGQFRPAQSQVVDGGWTKHTFDPQGGAGPICIGGAPYTAFTKVRNPTKVMVYFRGGGGCWQDFYNCTSTADTVPPVAAGVFADQFVGPTGEVVPNPLADWSVVYGSYCDGSAFTGDREVTDPVFPGGVRHHRGLRNASAVMDLAKAYFPHVTHLLIAGSSAGGLGASIWSPFLARMTWGNTPKLMVFDDAGPYGANLAATADVQARAADWAWGQFLPASCTDCSDQSHFTPLINWRLAHDRKLREALYSTDADAVQRFFLRVPTQELFRSLLLQQSQILVDAHPDRYKRFVRSGTDTHTSWRGPLFYTATADGVPLPQWVGDFLINQPGWVDIVEELVPLP